MNHLYAADDGANLGGLGSEMPDGHSEASGPQVPIQGEEAAQAGPMSPFELGQYDANDPTQFHGMEAARAEAAIPNAK